MHCIVIQKSKYVVHSSSWSEVEHTTINRYLNQDAKRWWLNDWDPSSPIALTTWSGSSFQVLTTLSWQLFQLAEVSELKKKRLPGVDSERPYPDLREKIVFMFLVSSIQREISKFIFTVVQGKFQKCTKVWSLPKIVHLIKTISLPSPSWYLLHSSNSDNKDAKMRA